MIFSYIIYKLVINKVNNIIKIRNVFFNDIPKIKRICLLKLPIKKANLNTQDKSSQLNYSKTRHCTQEKKKDSVLRSFTTFILHNGQLEVKEEKKISMRNFHMLQLKKKLNQQLQNGVPHHHIIRTDGISSRSRLKVLYRPKNNIIQHVEKVHHPSILKKDKKFQSFNDKIIIRDLFDQFSGFTVNKQSGEFRKNQRVESMIYFSQF